MGDEVISDDFALRRAYGLEERDTVQVDEAQEAVWARKMAKPIPQVHCSGSRTPGDDFGLLIATCPVCSKPHGTETWNGRLVVERHTRDAPHINAPLAAKSRAVIRLNTGRAARLVYWPIPAEERVGEKRGKNRARARVEVRPGVVITVKPHEVIFEEGLDEAALRLGE